MRRNCIALAGSLVLLASACGGSQKTAAADCRETKLSTAYRDAAQMARPLVRRLYAGLRAPGLSLAVGAGSEVVWSVNCGYADLVSRRAVTDHTRFRIGSVSPTILWSPGPARRSPIRATATT